MRSVTGLLSLVLALASCGDGGGGTPTGAPAAEAPAACTAVRSPQLLAPPHIQPPAKGTYNSVPPTSGPHYPAPAPAGVYDEPIANELQVHNLEHGHVMVQHRGLTEEQVAALRRIVESDPRMVVMAPYPDMVPRLALTAWGRIQTCDEVNAEVLAAVRAFIETYRDRAPESIP